MEFVENETHQNLKLQTRKKSFSIRRKKGSHGRQGAACSTGSQTMAKSGAISLSLSKSSSFNKLLKRKEPCSPDLPKKKPFRKMALPFMSGTSHSTKCKIPENVPDSPSAFESELSDQENQSPNDPEFVRRAAYRWKQKNGISQPNNFHFRYPNAYCLSTVPSLNLPATSQLPVYPGQQPLCQKSVSSSPVAMGPYLLESDSKLGQLASMAQHLKPQREEEPLTEHMACKDTSSNAKTRKMSIKRSFKRHASESARKLFPKASMDDSVAEAVLKEAQRAEQSNGNDTAVTSLLNQLNINQQRSLGTLNKRRSRSFSSWKSSSSSAAQQGSCSSHSGGLAYSSKSYHGELSMCASSNTSASQLSFEDIFVTEPAVAEKFAIMFPSEPRPEWHRHLRQVLHKAGQKIFKKPEHHDTNIPENLRYQLKQIYVY